MKKTVALILIFLPIFLMISISLAGSLFSVFGTVKVEKIVFVDEDENEISDGITLGMNQSHQLNVKVLPEKASDPTVYFYSEENNKENGTLIVTEKGLITTRGFGSAKVTVSSKDGRVRCNITVVVSDKEVSEISLDFSETTMKLGSTHRLSARILPLTAQNKRVIWSSSDTSKVQVDQNGNLSAIAQTLENQPIIITATSESSGLSATCSVIVRDVSEITFVKKGENIPILPQQDIVVKNQTIDLTDYIMITVDFFTVEEVEFVVMSGSDYELNGTKFIFTQSGKTLRLRASVKVDGKLYYAEAFFRYDDDNI